MWLLQVAEVTPSHPESSESSSTCGDSDPADLTFTTATTSTSPQADIRHLQPDTSYAIRWSSSSSSSDKCKNQGYNKNHVCNISNFQKYIIRQSEK